jgi:hypothetical protein
MSIRSLGVINDDFDAVPFNFAHGSDTNAIGSDNRHILVYLSQIHFHHSAV